MRITTTEVIKVTLKVIRAVIVLAISCLHLFALRVKSYFTAISLMSIRMQLSGNIKDCFIIHMDNVHESQIISTTTIPMVAIIMTRIIVAAKM